MVTTLNSKALKETLGPLAAKMRALTEAASNDNRDLTAEEDATFEELHTEYERVKGHADRLARVEQIETDTQSRADAAAAVQRQPTPGREDTSLVNPTDQTPQITEQTRSDAMAGWALHQAGQEDHITDAHRNAATLLGTRFSSPHWDANLNPNYRQVRRDFLMGNIQLRAQGVGTDTAGGFTVAEGFIANLERALLAFGGMRQVSTVIRTTEGNNLPWPTSDDTSNEGIEIGENTQVTEQDITYGQVVFHAHKYTSKLVRVSVELLTDSAFNIASETGSMLGERLARITNRRYTAGDGSNQPEGVTVGGTLGVTAAAAMVFTVDELYDLKHSVDPAYRLSPTWMINDTTLLAIKKKKDGEGRYLWQSSLAGGIPDTIDGDPIQVNQHMPSPTSALRPIVYGDFSKYVIRDVLGIRTRRLVERYAEFDQEGFVAFLRTDGKIIDAGTNPLKYMLMA